MDGHLLRYNKKIKYAFLDLETYNLCLNFCHNRPWQVGMIEVEGDSMTGSQDIRVDWSKDAPHLKIGEKAAIITHFSQAEHDKLAIDPKVAFKKFWPTLKSVDYIIMHNGLRFDLYLLKGYAEMMGEPWKFLMPKIIDTKAIAQGIKLNNPYNPQQGDFLEYQYRMANDHTKGVKTSLSTLAKEFEIPYDEGRMHDAIYDLTINLAVWNRLKIQIEL